MLRMLTARAATSPTVRNDAIDSISIRLLMRTLSGSTSQHLTHSGRCPLLVLPRPAVNPSAADAEREEATSGSVS
jgi:hypothetical protein